MQVDSLAELVEMVTRVKMHAQHV